MTDLCYNCGSCHFPQKCKVPLVPCDICRQWGHTWNFCHLGPLRKQPDYKYFALCHNCDAWHLPEPCTKDAVRCPECDQAGHLPYYCPMRPLRHPINAENSNATEDEASRAPKPSNQELLHGQAFAQDVMTMKMIAVKDALELSKLYRPEEVYRYLSQAYQGQHLQPQPVMPPRTARPPMAPPNQVTASESPESKPPNQALSAGHYNTSIAQAVQSTPAVTSRFVPAQTPQGVSQLVTPNSIQTPAGRGPAHDPYQRIVNDIGAYNNGQSVGKSVEERPEFLVSSPVTTSSSSVKDGPREDSHRTPEQPADSAGL